MALPYPTALAYGLLPALVGAGLGFFLLRPARQAAAGKPELAGLAMVLHAMPATSVLFAFAASHLSTTEDVDARFLGAVGLMAGLCGAVQGRVGGKGFAVVAQDPARFGRLLIAMVLPEALVVVPFLAFVVATFTG